METKNSDRSFFEKIISKIDPKKERSRIEKKNQDRREIIDSVRTTPGEYPLEQLSFIPSVGGEPGFAFSFNFDLKGETIPIEYWSYNHWGINVQKHPKDFPPKLEILDPKQNNGLTLLHLPDGYQIPVGPLQFQEDSLPIKTKELEDEKKEAIKLAESLGIKMNKKTRNTFERLNEITVPTRKSVNRYFIWQPELSNEPTCISIDFQNIKTYHMSLTPETAPIFTNTKQINDEK